MEQYFVFVWSTLQLLAFLDHFHHYHVFVIAISHHCTMTRIAVRTSRAHKCKPGKPEISLNNAHGHTGMVYRDILAVGPQRSHVYMIDIRNRSSGEGSGCSSTTGRSRCSSFCKRSDYTCCAQACVCCSTDARHGPIRVFDCDLPVRFPHHHQHVLLEEVRLVFIFKMAPFCVPSYI